MMKYVQIGDIKKVFKKKHVSVFRCLLVPNNMDNVILRVNPNVWRSEEGRCVAFKASIPRMIPFITPPATCVSVCPPWETRQLIFRQRGEFRWNFPMSAS